MTNLENDPETQNSTGLNETAPADAPAPTDTPTTETAEANSAPTPFVVALSPTTKLWLGIGGALVLALVLIGVVVFDSPKLEMSLPDSSAPPLPAPSTTSLPPENSTFPTTTSHWLEMSDQEIADAAQRAETMSTSLNLSPTQLADYQDFFDRSPVQPMAYPAGDPEIDYHSCFFPEACFDLYALNPLHVIHYLYRPYERNIYASSIVQDPPLNSLVIDADTIRQEALAKFGLTDLDFTIHENYDAPSDNFVWRSAYGDGGGDCFSWKVSNVRTLREAKDTFQVVIADLVVDEENSCNLEVTSARNYLLTQLTDVGEIYIANFINPE